MDTSAAFLEKRMADLARREGHTRFLEPGAMVELARKVAREAGVEVTFFGGYPEAERTVAFFHSGEAPAPECIVRLRLEWNARYATCGHRDLLGAVMGLGVEREMLGDILVEEGCARLFVLEEIAQYVQDNLDSAGKARLQVRLDDGAFQPPEPEGVFLRETVGSVRLDAVVAAGYDLSREKAQKLVAQGMVKLNHVECLRADARMTDGDLISVRGFGRLRLVEVLGETRKSRIAVRLFRYAR